MKHSVTYLVTALLAFSNLKALAQRPVPGYVLTLGGDSLRGAIQLHDDLAQQTWVEFIPLNGTQTLFLDAYQLTAYGYQSKESWVRYTALPFSQPNKTAPFRGFLEELENGPVQMFTYRYAPFWSRRAVDVPLLAANGPSRYPVFKPLSRQSATYFGDVPRYSLVVYRPDRPQLREVDYWNMRQDAAEYFSDYPELAADLRAGRYRPADIREVVRRYNEWHKEGKTTR